MLIASWAVLVLAALVTALVASVYAEGRQKHGRPQYVAMGSSFAAGPAITERAENSPWFCWPSRDNYAHQLARMTGLSLVDMSCGGATTKEFLEGGLAMLPPQIGAVTEETELVTVTIGGNDIGYLGNLMAMSCDSTTPWYLSAIGACRIRSAEQMERDLPKLGEHLVAIIDEVRRRAPRARIVLLNYQTILPQSGTCERLGLSSEQVDLMRGIAAKLAGTTDAVAKAHGALLFDAMRLSQDHDVCAREPWINGMHPPGGLLGAPLHPNLAGMTATAEGLSALLGASASGRSGSMAQ